MTPSTEFPQLPVVDHTTVPLPATPLPTPHAASHAPPPAPTPLVPEFAPATDAASGPASADEWTILHAPGQSVELPAADAFPTDSPSEPSSASVAPEAPELIPVRMLNEFTYCPRLGYLEWIQGEFADNLETLEGTFGHRRVDLPSRGAVPDPAASKTAGGKSTRGKQTASAGASVPVAGSSETDEPQADEGADQRIHARSLMLSAPGEGLIAKLDLLEGEGTEVTPVDYKRGSVPNNPEQSWEPERVQLCAQGLILRETGFQCDSGVLYFIESRRRVVIDFDDGLVARTRELVAALRETASRRVLPPPLVDSPKCPRCSLVGICLPDEVNLLTSQQAPHAADVETASDGETADGTTGAGKPPPPAARVRMLLPVRNDALPLYLQEQGTTLGKDGDRLTIRRKTEVIQHAKLYDVSQISVFGNVQITAQALREATSRGIPICHFSYGGWLHAVTTGLVHKNVELRIRQFAVAGDARASLPIARAIIAGKIRNCRTLLRRHLPDDDRPELKFLAESIARAERAAGVETLLGIEGMAAKVYFGGFARLLKGGPAFEIDGRNRRPPRDPVNSLLSFVYALLVKELTIVLQSVGFDPMLGVYHRPRYGRPSLALDLAEEFRPLIGDSTVLMLVNNGEVSESSFITRAGAVALTDAGRRAVIAAFERRLDSEVSHPIFGYRITYRRILEVQARLLARTILGELAGYPNFCTR